MGLQPDEEVGVNVNFAFLVDRDAGRFERFKASVNDLLGSFLKLALDRLA